MPGKEEVEIKVIRYNPSYCNAWNRFNQTAANGLFLFDRNYLAYHQHRFQDHSLLFYLGKELVGIFPMNAELTEAVSHRGLTFGGLVVGLKVKIHLYLQLFEALLGYLRTCGFTKLIIKPIPFIFHQHLTLDDQYAFFLYGFRLQSRSLSSCLELNADLHYTKGRKWSLVKARQAELIVTPSQDYETFMDLVKQVLENKYQVSPTHTAAEIMSLAQSFPENIQLLTVYHAGELIGGTIIYLSPAVVHLQYIATSNTGKKLHALDLLLHYLITAYRGQKQYINFGISPGSDQYGLNTGLIQNKESYGARSLPQDIYELTL
jgi:hypothetical protein